MADCSPAGRAYETGIPVRQYTGSHIWISLFGKGDSPGDPAQGAGSRTGAYMGYPREDLIGQSALRLHTDAAAWENFGRLACQALETAGTYTCEQQMGRRCGELFWVQAGGSCLQSSSGAYCPLHARQRALANPAYGQNRRGWVV